jgi:hypothetical protein
MRRRIAEKGDRRDACITLNHEKGTGTAPVVLYATLGSSLRGGASPFFMTGTVPMLFLTDVTCCVARSQFPFAVGVFALKKGTGTVPMLFPTNITCRVARSQSPFSASVFAIHEKNRRESKMMWAKW